MKFLLLTLLSLSSLINAKDIQDDIDDWLAGRKIQVLKTTVKNYWPDKTDKQEKRINLEDVINKEVLIDTNDQLALLVKVPGMSEIGKGRSGGVVVGKFKYRHDGKILEVLAVFEYKKALNKRTLTHLTFKTSNFAESKTRYALIPSQP
ncbi:hypothetical protein PQO01_08170 [Lentisphaera marina]|uniref:hypothetical protein n=1 Tax=Lentisphaera marina TaxID=1111041 RepID=UPI002365F660|nr:hypothetical protein [Lentisphaera marina]MDD7984918.1 hypothetical protein [Lentisphaera marina]